MRLLFCVANHSLTGHIEYSYYEEAHAADAQTSMHCAEVEGHTIAVQVYEPAKGSIRGLNRQSWAEAPIFTPRHTSMALPQTPAVSMWASPPRRTASSSQIYSPAEVVGMTPVLPYGMPMVPINAVNAPLVDPTNLFVKGLDPIVTSQDLFAAFKPFGRIVSARVMRDEHTGLSKEFGFVSYTRAEDAAMAQQAMNGQGLDTTQGMTQAITVRFHEPKKQRISSYGVKRAYGMPREREGSFDSQQNMTEDIVRRVSGMSPTGVGQVSCLRLVSERSSWLSSLPHCPLLPHRQRPRFTAQ